MFGVTFEQGRNELNIDEELLSNFVTKEQRSTRRGAARYEDRADHPEIYPVNSVCYVKADRRSVLVQVSSPVSTARDWQDRKRITGGCVSPPQVLGLQFVDGLGRADRDNAIDVYMGDEYEDVLAEGVWQTRLKVKPAVFTREEKTCMVKPADRCNPWL